VRRDDVQDEVIYRCVNGACVRPLPRRVNYCPYCGISQSTGLLRPADTAAAVPAAAPVSFAKPAPAAPAPAAAPVPSPPKAAPTASPPRATVPARPPQREPVRLRYWLLALGILWLIWITQRPTPQKIDARIDSAIALATACKAGEAQAELIELKDSTATPAQLQRLQSALNEADAACARKRARPAPKAARPLAREQAQSARNLLADARQAMARGDYAAASSKMEVCAAMVDAGNRECSVLKAKADRLQGELQRCLADGREWVADRCQ
jgi:hypothetical protein